MGRAMRGNVSSFVDDLRLPNAHSRVRSSAPRRQLVLDTLRDPGSALLLLGEPGTGKTSLASEAPDILASSLGVAVRDITLPEPPLHEEGTGQVFSRAFPELAHHLLQSEQHGPLSHDAAETFGDILLAAIDARVQGAPVLIVAPAIDMYAPASEQLLRLLVRSERYRIIMTAHRLTATADRFLHLPNVRTATLGPLTTDEAQEFVSQILRVERVEEVTLRRWLALTEGNAYALALLTYACDRQGRIRRRRGVAWTEPGEDVVPEEMETYLLNTCTPDELHALELIALTEPLRETDLIRSVDADALRRLHDRGLIQTQSFEAEGFSLRTAHPLLSAAILKSIPPHRRIVLQDMVVEHLRSVVHDADHVDTVQLLRLVRFALASGQDIPMAWLRRALRFMNRIENPRLGMQLAIMYAEHPDRDPNEAAVYLTRAYHTGRTMSDAALTSRMLATIRDLSEAPSLDPRHRFLLRLSLFEDDWGSRHDTGECLADIDALEQQAAREAPESVAVLRDLRPLLFLAHGDLRSGSDMLRDIPLRSLGDLSEHPVSALAHAMVLLQAGNVAESIRFTETVIQVLLLEEDPRYRLVELHAFVQILGHWMLGNPGYGRERLDQLVDSIGIGTHTQLQQPGLPDLLLAMFALQEGKVRFATQKAERLLEHLRAHDPYRVSPLVNALLANTLAILGETAAAATALHHSRTPLRGLSQALGGVLRILQAQASLWVPREAASPDLLLSVAWARDSLLPLVELRLVHLMCCASGAVSQDELSRAQALAKACDEEAAGPVVQHLAWMHDASLTGGTSTADPSVPEVRLLALAGIVLPHRYDVTLTSREREVALLATLGYPTREIASMLHISPRTVEAHLGHVFQKLGVTGRTGLRTRSFDLRTSHPSASVDGWHPR